MSKEHFLVGLFPWAWAREGCASPSSAFLHRSSGTNSDATPLILTHYFFSYEHGFIERGLCIINSILTLYNIVIYPELLLVFTHKNVAPTADFKIVTFFDLLFD